MASEEARRLWAEMKKHPSNRACVECGGNDPTWASVSYGNLFCLECSGVHRSLGVHISFVRSLGMDKWSDEQMQYMRLGGNEKCKKFFEKHGIPRSMPIQERYHTEVAAAYKEKLKCLVQGKPYKEPPIGSLSTVPQMPQRKTIGLSSASQPQGGEKKKYSGMGNYTPPQKSANDDDWGAYFSSGLSSLSSVASVAAATTGQYAKIAAEKFQETSAGISESVQKTNWNDKFTNLGTTVSESSNTGWGALSSYWQSAKEYTSQALSGETAPNSNRPVESLEKNWEHVKIEKEENGWDSWDDFNNEKDEMDEPDQKIEEEEEKPNKEGDGWEDVDISEEDEWQSWQ